MGLSLFLTWKVIAMLLYLIVYDGQQVVLLLGL